jgi:exodeoxyribonuclease VII small subunit
MPKKAKTFESALKELREIVDTMERGELPLSQMVDMYKSGMELSLYCDEYLNKIEDELTILRASATPDTSVDLEDK